MNILLFPTRFYPAISGGDFFLEQLGWEFKQRNKRQRYQVKVGNRDGLHAEQDDILFFTSDAIDFSALHGEGKRVESTHKNFSQYRGLSVRRFETAQEKFPPGEESIPSANALETSKFITLVQQYFGWDLEIYRDLLANGPLLPGLTELLASERIRESVPFQPDIIHCSYMPYLNLIYALILGKIYGIPTCITPFLHFANSRYQNTAFYTILQEFTRIFACTHFERQKLIEGGVPGHKIQVVPMGVDIGRFTRQDYSADFIAQFALCHPIVLFCGYKNYEKGALSILNAIRKLDKQKIAISWVLIGPTTASFNYEYQKLKKEIALAKIVNLTPDNLTGVYDRQKIGAFQAADIYCMPSRSDAYGISYLEAWASDTAVIAADIPAMHEVVTPHEDGLLVRFGDSEEIAAAIRKLITEPELRTSMAKRGRQKVVHANQWQKIAQAIRVSYDSCLRDPHQRS